MGWQDTERGHTGMARVLNKVWMDVRNTRKGFNKERSTEGEEERENGCIDRWKPYVWEEPAKNWGANEDVWWKRMRERRN